MSVYPVSPTWVTFGLRNVSDHEKLYILHIFFDFHLDQFMLVYIISK